MEYVGNDAIGEEGTRKRADTLTGLSRLGKWAGAGISSATGSSLNAPVATVREFYTVGLVLRPRRRQR
eukprot:3032296-Heterocapsa_arctica.AAC.1